MRNLVEFLLRSGDITEGAQGGSAVTAMKKGAALHRRIQKQMGADYHAEVPLSFCMSYEDYDLVVSGRADGVIYEPGEDPVREAVIDEIKGIYADVSRMEEPQPLHLAQAKCYAFIFAFDHQLEEMGVQMTYGNLEPGSNHKRKRFRYTYRFSELKEWFMGLLADYKRWSDFSVAWKRKRQESIHALAFPFSYRKGQKKLMQDVYRSIHAKKLLFLQAPTGTGKTIATIFPAVKAMGEGLCDRIFYVTAKTAAKSVAKDTFRLLGESGHRAKTVELTARDKVCPMVERSCNPKDCPWARGHYDRINDAVFDIVTHRDLIDRESMMEWAETYRVCPFEFSLDIALWCDHIIGDYNYIFDPHVSLKRFFGEGSGEENIFLVDEAHNLVERGRDMYSASLCKDDFLAVRRLVKDREKKLATALMKCNKILLKWKKLKEDTRVMDLAEIDELVFALMRLAGEMDRFFERRPGGEGVDAILELYFQVKAFLEITDELSEESFRAYTDQDIDRGFFVKLLCIDPSKLIQRRLERARSTIFFSATLLPVNYYRSLLCDTEETYAIYAESAFREENRAVFIGGDVTSIYRRRNVGEYKRFAEYIRGVTSARAGNYMVFAPSYAFLEQVLGFYEDMAGVEIKIIVQSREMDEVEREMFLDRFRQKREGTLVGFCVIGGVFSEGIDLVGERLIGAIILGCPLPMVTRERGIIQEFFGREGFHYAYLYPGMNKVLQAAGRVIRTAEDTGVILLLDERYQRSEYRQGFPREWKRVDLVQIGNVKDKVSQFCEDVDG